MHYTNFCENLIFVFSFYWIYFPNDRGVQQVFKVTNFRKLQKVHNNLIWGCLSFLIFVNV